MFTKPKEAEASIAPTHSPSPSPSSSSLSHQQPSPPVPQPKRQVRSGVPSIISAELIVKGTLVSAGDVQIDGRVEGDIRSTGLVVGEKATILGDIYAEEVAVRGRVEGSVRARKVQLCATCHVEGNILHEALAIESGAFFEGNCRHSENPLADTPDFGLERRPSDRQRPGSSAMASPLKAAAEDIVTASARSAAASVSPLKN